MWEDYNDNFHLEKKKIKLANIILTYLPCCLWVGSGDGGCLSRLASDTWVKFDDWTIRLFVWLRMGKNQLRPIYRFNLTVKTLFLSLHTKTCLRMYVVFAVSLTLGGGLKNCFTTKKEKSCNNKDCFVKRVRVCWNQIKSKISHPFLSSYEFPPTLLLGVKDRERLLCIQIKNV